MYIGTHQIDRVSILTVVESRTNCSHQNYKSAINELLFLIDFLSQRITGYEFSFFCALSDWKDEIYQSNFLCERPPQAGLKYNRNQFLYKCFNILELDRLAAFSPHDSSPYYHSF